MLRLISGSNSKACSSRVNRCHNSLKTAVRSTVAKRKNQAEFIRRGIAAIEATKRDGSGIPVDVVIAKLEAKLTAAKQVKVN